MVKNRADVEAAEGAQINHNPDFDGISVHFVKEKVTAAIGNSE